MGLNIVNIEFRYRNKNVVQNVKYFLYIIDSILLAMDIVT